MSEYRDSGFVGSDYRGFEFGPDIDVEFEKPRNISAGGAPLYSDEGVSVWIRYMGTISHHLMFSVKGFEQFCSALDTMRTKVSFDVMEYREREEAAQRATAE